MIEINVDDDELLNPEDHASQTKKPIRVGAIKSRLKLHHQPNDTTPIRTTPTTLYTESSHSQQQTSPSSPSSNSLAYTSTPAFKHGSGEVANNVKCVFTSVVFIAIIIAVIIITFYKNPEM